MRIRLTHFFLFSLTLFFIEIGVSAQSQTKEKQRVFRPKKKESSKEKKKARKNQKLVNNKQYQKKRAKKKREASVGKKVDVRQRGKQKNKPTNAKVDVKERSRKSKKIETAEKKAKSTQLIFEAKKHRGVRYRYGGESPNSGFDCSGFTQYVFKKKGIDLPRNSREQARKGQLVKSNKVRKGDLVFFGRSKNRISHVGIVVSEKGEPLKMIHASSSSGVTITDLTKSDYWKKRLLFFRRIR